jgi:protein TonB
LLIFEKGKEVYRQAPVKEQAEPSSVERGDGMQRASSVERVALSPAESEGILLHRVEPEYPEEARQQKVQGVVVLDVRIGADGGVEEVQFVSGPPELAQPSTDAVRQWRFKPRTANGRPVEMQTRVSLNFRLQE